MVSAETIERTLPFISCTRAQFQERARRETAGLIDLRGDHWAFNPLQSYPMIRVAGSDSLYVVPVPRLLLERLIEAPYYILLEADGETFTGPFGYLFEAYVGAILQPYTNARLQPEITYGNEKSSDWLVVDDDAVALLECKTGRLNKAAKTVAPVEDVAAVFARQYGQATAQLPSNRFPWASSSWTTAVGRR